jgi:hypothetical protein
MPGSETCATVFEATLSRRVPGLTQFAATSVGDAIWMAYPHDISSVENRQLIYTTSITADAVQHGTRVVSAPTNQLVLDATTEFLASTELLPGTNGAWFAGLLIDGQARMAWLYQDGSKSAFADLGVSPSWPAFPLAVRGTDLAMSYRVREDATTASWQILWVTPGQSTGPTSVPAPAVVRQGPTLVVARDIQRLGGFAYERDGTLVIAGARASDPRSVTLWSVPWQGTAEPQLVGTIPKLSSVVPRRLAITRNGNAWQAVWTERIPEVSSGFSAYTALYTGKLLESKGGRPP